jgi:hypothetical protein
VTQDNRYNPHRNYEAFQSFSTAIDGVDTHINDPDPGPAPGLYKFLIQMSQVYYYYLLLKSSPHTIVNLSVKAPDGTTPPLSLIHWNG